MLHESRACHFVLCHDVKELSHADLCSRVALGSCRVTAMSHGCLESQRCSLTHSLQTLHQTFTCRSHQPIHAEERKGIGAFSVRGLLPPLSCSPPLCPSSAFPTFSLRLYLTLSPPASSTCNVTLS